MPSRVTALGRWLRHVAVAIGDGCWEWTGCLAGPGYGYFRPLGTKGSSGYAHRFAYEQFVGPIPEGHYVLHHCDSRKCVRPDHLFTGTQKDNIHDMLAKGRARWQKAR